MLESTFRSIFIEKLRDGFPGCVILKNDPNELQGFPDLTILYKNHWALFETKQYRYSSKRRNQAHYIEWARKESYGAFVSPENMWEVLHELELAFRA